MAELLVALAYRRSLRRERVFRDPLDPLEVSDEHLLKHYGFPRQDILRLCEELRPVIERATNRSHAIPCHTQVLVALGLYTSGGFQAHVGDSTGLSQSSVSRVINKVTDAIFMKAVSVNNIPMDDISIKKVKDNFQKIDNFPNIVGIIDCTHIPMKGHIDSDGMYKNKKEGLSLKVQVICDSGMQFLKFWANPGGLQDAAIWTNSDLQEKFEAGDFGEGYVLGKYSFDLILQ